MLISNARAQTSRSLSPRERRGALTSARRAAVAALSVNGAGVSGWASEGGWDMADQYTRALGSI